ncbi:MAG: hypothetical protein ACPL88_01930 [Bryobacteraceae bacterium]
MRRATACGAILALLALSILFVVPHSWHKEDGKRACAVCQALRVPSAPAQTPPDLKPPEATYAEVSEASPSGQSQPCPLAYTSRAPPSGGSL